MNRIRMLEMGIHTLSGNSDSLSRNDQGIAVYASITHTQVIMISGEIFLPLNFKTLLMLCQNFKVKLQVKVQM